jgi:hypothetical protein
MQQTDLRTPIFSVTKDLSAFNSSGLLSAAILPHNPFSISGFPARGRLKNRLHSSTEEEDEMTDYDEEEEGSVDSV